MMIFRRKTYRRKSAAVFKMLPDEKIAPIRRQKTERQKLREVSVIRKVITVITVCLILLLIVAAVLLVRQAKSSGGFHWAWLDEFLGRETESSASSLDESSAEESLFISLPSQEEDSDDLLIIVNSIHPLPEDYAPELAEVGGVYLQDCAAQDLAEMIAAADQAGIRFSFLRGFTTPIEQEAIYQEKYEALLYAGTSSAKAKDTASIYKPGWSESQTGLLLELSGGTDFETSNEYFWLCEHSAEYGFIFRYPEGKTRKTGVAFDPKILRYVGKENAATLRQLDMCLEEYVRYLSDR